jgi:hypothetical protein
MEAPAVGAECGVVLRTVESSRGRGRGRRMRGYQICSARCRCGEPGPLGMVLLIVSGKAIEWVAVQSFTSPVMLSQSVCAAPARHLVRRGGSSSASRSIDGWMDHGCDWLIRISVRVCVSASFAKF